MSAALDQSRFTSASAVNKKQALVVGLGKTGFSCVRFLHARGHSVRVVDSRDIAPCLKELQEGYPDIELHTGSFASPWFSQSELVVVSPGVSTTEASIQDAVNSGADVVGDVELFAREIKKNVIAITGSNGKSTVTSLVGEMCKAAGLNTAVGGNLGTPILELLNEENKDAYVVELSSFQLDTTKSLKNHAAIVLNISADHLDRYDGLVDYADAKARIYKNAAACVVNRDDNVVMNMIAPDQAVCSFGGNEPSRPGQFGLVKENGETWIAHHNTCLISSIEMSLAGGHNLINAAAALSVFTAAGHEINENVLQAIKEFRGLPHRCELVRELDGVRWINDSKGTNVGATIAALQGMSETVVLIAGGQGKGADFSKLREVLRGRVKHLVLFGEDAALIEQAVDDVVPATRTTNLQEAVALARKNAISGNTVLFSPACASFDMFDNFMQRGDTFAALVRELGR